MHKIVYIGYAHTHSGLTVFFSQFKIFFILSRRLNFYLLNSNTIASISLQNNMARLPVQGTAEYYKWLFKIETQEFEKEY